MTSAVAGDAYVATTAAMGTVVSVQVVGHGTSQRARRERKQGVARALAWFAHIESICSRFDAQSEVRQLSTQVGRAVPVSDVLFEAVQFALAVAEASGGAFDPTIGVRLESRGFDIAHRDGARVSSAIDADRTTSYRDVAIDTDARTITLQRPLVLDLGAVAKGLAIDTAARALAPFANFAIDAGGDMYVGGVNEHDAPWTIGIRHPRDSSAVFARVHLSDTAICTSGDYERPGHLLDPRADATASALASVTVIAPSAMVADALGTAAFVLGPVDGLAFLEHHALRALLITPALARIVTDAWRDTAEVE